MRYLHYETLESVKFVSILLCPQSDRDGFLQRRSNMIDLKIIHIDLPLLKKLPLAVAAITVLTGCQSLNFKEMAYSALRHNDCQRNEIEVFCTRSYQREYYEYERTRDELLQKRKETTGTSSWTVSKNDSIVL